MWESRPEMRLIKDDPPGLEWRQYSLKLLYSDWHHAYPLCIVNDHDCDIVNDHDCDNRYLTCYLIV